MVKISFWRKIIYPLFPITVEDAQFGQLELDWVPNFLPDGDGKDHYLWRNGTAQFAPLNKQTSVAMDVESDEGASPYQRQLFESIELSWDDFKDELAEQLLEHMQEWLGEMCLAKSGNSDEFFDKYVEFDGVFLGAKDRPNYAAELSFSPAPAALHELPSGQQHGYVGHYLAAQLRDGALLGVHWQ